MEAVSTDERRRRMRSGIDQSKLASALWSLAAGPVSAAFTIPMKAGLRASEVPFAQNAIELRPYVGARRYGWTHYGVMISDLPEPHRHFSVMVMAGTPGFAAFDVETQSVDRPRDAAAVSVSTAADGAYQYGVRSVVRDCHLADDGSLLEFGRDLQITGTYPRFTVEVNTPGLQAELAFECGSKATWFIKSAIYDHLSFIGRYHGTISSAAGSQDVAGVGNIEYARCVGPYSLRRSPRALPASLQIPLDFFTYHVVNVPDGQILFARLNIARRPAAGIFAFRTFDGDRNWSTIDDTYFEVDEYFDEPQAAPDGSRMRLPAIARFGVRDRIDIHAQYDSPQRYGVGKGYITGYRATVSTPEARVETRGYSEYVNVSS